MKAIICNNTSNVLHNTPTIIKGDTWMWKRIDDHVLIECDNNLNIDTYYDRVTNRYYSLGQSQLLFDSIVDSEYFNTHQQAFMVQPKFFVPGLLLV